MKTRPTCRDCDRALTDQEIVTLLRQPPGIYAFVCPDCRGRLRVNTERFLRRPTRRMKQRRLGHRVGPPSHRQ